MTNIIKKSLTPIYRYLLNNFSLSEIDIINRELEKIASFDSRDYMSIDVEKSVSYEELQNDLVSFNEKGMKRKSNGVYYTSNDVVKFILSNTVKSYYDILKPTNLHVQDLNGIPYKKFAYQNTVFDPTCGTGEFLIVVLGIKLDLIDLHKDVVSCEDIKKVLSTIFGNDIDNDSTTICKFRLFLYVLNRYGVNKICGIANILNVLFTNYDFINLDNTYSNRFDIIIGNPPYVEDSKCDTKPNIKFGNVYANVLDNVTKCLNRNGVLGFIIPLSYVSTPRMSSIRSLLCNVLSEQYILSYCDRPDCLFSSVHQKLCILIGKNGEQIKNKIYTSNYQFWYKEERKELFSVVTAILNKFGNDKFIPKVGTSLDSDIYVKVTSNKECLYDLFDDNGESLFINMRASFWIKAFRNDHSSNEYKKFSLRNKNIANFCMCLLNSSLFWWYWICVSDCWHLTNKELKGFTIPKIIDFDIFNQLANDLEQKLEKTKVYVGTKQTEYEYKHRACIDEIHNIDDAINKVYGLSEEECIYIKNYALKYRIGGGVKL